MARHYEFKPDKPRSGLLSKLFLTQKQRASLLKWSLYALLLLALSVLQDVLMCRFRIFGATTNLVPCGIFLICLSQGLESGSVFGLVAASLYLFSGSAAGYHSIILITFLCVYVAYFRQSYLRKGFGAIMLCTVFCIFVYELAVFGIGVFLKMTVFGRIGTHAMTAALTCVAAPILYPIVKGIYAIGGEAWKE